jgi:hypothetical protein
VFFPDNYSDLLKLKKGVGEYTAAAMLRFLTMKWFRCGRNVFQVLSRYFDVETDIALASAKKEFAALAFRLMQKTILLTRRLWSSVLCNAYLNQIVVFACLTIVVLRTKESRSAACKI